MITTSLLTLLSLTTLATSLTNPPPSQNQHPIQPNPLSPLPNTTPTLRPLTRPDLPTLSNLLIDAFRPSPTWHYLMPEFSKHETSIRHCLYRELVQSWETHDPAKTLANVITVPLPSGGGERVVAGAVWQLRDEKEANNDAASQSNFQPLSLLTNSAVNCASHPGINTTRAASLASQTAAVERDFIRPLARRQFHLHLLATHPEWDGHGFGATHCKWGEERARETGRMVTLLATPVGWELYRSLGWEGVRNVSVERLDGEAGLWFEVVRWEG